MEPPATSSDPSVAPVAFPPEGKAFFGAFTSDGPYDLAALDRFTATTKRAPQVVMFAQGWGVNRFDRAVFDRIANRNKLPMLSWEPWNYRLEPVHERLRGVQTEYQLSKIISGRFDAYVRSWARGIKQLGYPVAIRFAHEMNGYWYPWCEQVNGNLPGEYVQAWRHVHDLFTVEAANNVIWVWSPNISYANSTPLAGLYPGDQFVDWVGLSGYYGTTGTEQYRTFDEIFDPTIAELRAFTQRPLVITEMGATDQAGRKAEWVHNLLTVLPQHGDIIGFIWYEAVKETDWRIAGTLAGQAFAAGVAGPRYDVQWSPNSVPRTWLSRVRGASSESPPASRTPGRRTSSR